MNIRYKGGMQIWHRVGTLVLLLHLHLNPRQLLSLVIKRMMYSIYVTSVIHYDSFVALASKNVPFHLLNRYGSADVWLFVMVNLLDIMV